MAVTVDRLFYYAGQQIKVKVRLDNTKGSQRCVGFELALARAIQGEGRNQFNRMDTQEFYETTNVKTQREQESILIGETGEFEYTIDLPACDELSFMPKYLTADEQQILTAWSSTHIG